MLGARSRLIFDTSAINALTAEADSAAILSSLGIGFQVRISETNLSEVSATPEIAARGKLLATCRHLVHAGECIRPYNWILEELTKMHLTAPERFEWDALSIHGPELEHELTRASFVGTDEFAKETLDDFEARSEEFEEIFNNARPAFEKIFEDKSEKRPNAPKVIEILMSESGAYWRLAAGMYRRACGAEIGEAGVKAFVDASPPFRCALVSLAIAQYYRCIRDQRGPGTYRAGRIDLFMAVYLPYCDQFITGDIRQFNSLSLVASDATPSTKVSTYQEFRNGFLI